MGLSRLGELRARAVKTLKRARRPWTWADFQRLKTAEGDPCAVMLTVPVWVPANARKLDVFQGSDVAWKTTGASTNLPHHGGTVFFAERLADINDKKHYRAATLSFYTYSLHAPLAFLLFHHVFREGWFDADRRIPIMAVRSGEDCYSADRGKGPLVAECASFKDRFGPGHSFTLVRRTYANAGVVLNACHVRRSNHRIGCAMDVNLFWFLWAMDGTINPITRSLRQFQRNKMHAVDARNLPGWFYDAAATAGYRIPQSWTYKGGRKDWTHIDVGK